MEPDSLFIEYQCKGNYKSGFVMTRSDFTIADKIIKNAVSREHVEYSVYLSTSTINKFRRQYIPYINDKDEKMVFINCVCRLLDYPVELDSGEYVFQRQELSKSIIWPDDGGDCYWRIWINLATKEFTLMVNGI
ncbi:MAG: hypothetical protein JJU28_08700 [Cyclobacteriaceae bacterium]|nr:hypothetical protein [Cyclobacteriaceae bacterium]